jgi:tetratricopeptide (TPR) repeat protein
LPDLVCAHAGQAEGDGAGFLAAERSRFEPNILSMTPRPSHPQGSAQALGQIAQAEEFERAGRADDACALWSALVAERPDDGGRRVLLGRFLGRRGDLARAAAQHRLALALDPGNLKIALACLELPQVAGLEPIHGVALAAILYGAEISSAAALWPLWTKAAPLGGRRLEAIARRAAACVMRSPDGVDAMASDIKDRIVAAFHRMHVLTSPDDGSAWGRLGRHLGGDNAAEALASIARGAALGGVDVETLLFGECVAAALSRPEIGAGLVRLAAALDPALVDPQARRANDLLGRGRLREALDAARQSATLDPASRVIGQTLGQIETLIAADGRRSARAGRRRRSRGDAPSSPAVGSGRIRASLTLPSLYPDMLALALRTLPAAFDGMDYEVLVVSPFPARGPSVRWIPEKVPCGNPAGHAAAMAAAAGDVVLSFTDDVLAAPGSLRNAVEFVMRREREGIFPFQAGLRWLVRGSSDQIGLFHGFYYAYFSAMSRRSVERIGGWYDPVFRAGFADIDISLRVWHRGGRVEQCRGALIYGNPLDALAVSAPLKTRRSAVADYERFRQRWRPVLPSGWGQGRNEYAYDLMSGYLVDDTAFPGQPGRDVDARAAPIPPA